MRCAVYGIDLMKYIQYCGVGSVPRQSAAGRTNANFLGESCTCSKILAASNSFNPTSTK